MSTTDPVETQRPRWIVVVQVTRPEVYARLRRVFEGARWVLVVVDRRRGERRRRDDLSETDRRLGGRRREDDATRVPEYRLAYHGDGHDVYEATALAGAPCPECELTVRFEMPRFVEPPARLDLTVVHETIQPKHARHFVELQSYTSTGRALVASRVTARVATEGR
jgi:hypothetical protein